MTALRIGPKKAIPSTWTTGVPTSSPTVMLRHSHRHARGPDHPGEALLQHPAGVQQVQAHDVVMHVNRAQPADLA